MVKIEKTDFSTKAGEITWYKMTAPDGASATVSNLGAGIVSICVPDKDGKMADVVLGYKDPADYMADGPCFGKVPGRYANRIAKGHLEIDGNTYQLAINNGPNALHGGPTGFQNHLWDSKVDGEKVIFTFVSPDGDEQYPGTLTTNVTYQWTEDHRLLLEIEATTDAKTVVNLTNHAYFNLDGENAGKIFNHKLQLNAECYLPTDTTQIPTGKLEPVAGTPMDFRQPKALGQDMGVEFDALKIGKGYDHCFVIDGWQKGEMVKVAFLSSDVSGRSLEVTSDQPGVQIYTGNWLSGCPESKSGGKYEDYDGVALECQGFPDAPHHSNFPSQELNPGETYRCRIQFKFIP